MNPGDTIFALSTAPGRAGIAVVRVSGPAARRAVDAIGRPVPEPRRAAFRRMRDGSGEEIDAGLVLFFAAPSTETGEDMAEFHLHGSRAVVAAMLRALGNLDGLRPAEAGEFARRAFENGKLDLTAVEGLADLIDAETTSQRKQALNQLGGGLARLYEGWRTRIVAVLALAEAGIDFVDEDDVPAGLAPRIAREVDEVASEIGVHLADDYRGERIREGARLVIAGPPNAGKSSLINALARRDVAIVADTPGTTRDAIEVRLDLGGVAVTAVDTAGLREAGDAIEAEGIRRTGLHLGAADLVLLLHEPAGSAAVPPGVDPSDVWHVASKADLVDSLPKESAGHDEFRISTVTGDGMAELIAALGEYFRVRFDTGTDPAITRERHRQELTRAAAALQRAAAGDYAGKPDVVAEDLRQAADAIGRLVGRVDVEDVLDVIFRDFCIGK